jgi:UDP-glucoronosyl and UDP-glucosyl transferase
MSVQRPGSAVTAGRRLPGMVGERRLRNRAFMKALAPGLPMVVLPYGHDQADNAARAMARGASVAVKRTAKAAGRSPRRDRPRAGRTRASTRRE